MTRSIVVRPVEAKERHILLFEVRIEFPNTPNAPTPGLFVDRTRRTGPIGPLPDHHPFMCGPWETFFTSWDRGLCVDVYVNARTCVEAGVVKVL